MIIWYTLGLCIRSVDCGSDTGAILTKMDGDSRGGAALSMKSVSGRPVKFISTGEKIDQLEPFYPDRVASRILGKNDILLLWLLLLPGICW